MTSWRVDGNYSIVFYGWKYHKQFCIKTNASRRRNIYSPDLTGGGDDKTFLRTEIKTPCNNCSDVLDKTDRVRSWRNPSKKKQFPSNNLTRQRTGCFYDDGFTSRNEMFPNRVRFPDKNGIFVDDTWDSAGIRPAWTRDKRDSANRFQSKPSCRTVRVAHVGLFRSFFKLL